MYAIQLDFITLVWAVVLFMAMPLAVARVGTFEAYLAWVTVALYLVAQSSWTTSYFSGYLFGVEWANYVWFAFNSCVMLLVTLNLRKH